MLIGASDGTCSARRRRLEAPERAGDAKVAFEGRRVLHGQGPAAVVSLAPAPLSPLGGGRVVVGGAHRFIMGKLGLGPKKSAVFGSMDSGQTNIFLLCELFCFRASGERVAVGRCRPSVSV